MKKKLGLRESQQCSKPNESHIYLRDIERGIRPEVGCGNSEALRDLVGSWGAVMLDVTALGLDIVGIEVGDCGDIGVGDLAVITLIVVVGQNLPIEIALHIPGMVKDVILKVVVLEPGLFIDTVKVIFPGNLGDLASIQIDPDETIPVNVHVDRREVAVMESFDASLVVPDDRKAISSYLVCNPVTSVGNTVLMGCEKPFPGEDRSSLKLVHVLRPVPGRRKRTDRLLLVLDWNSRSAKEVLEKRH